MAIFNGVKYVDQNVVGYGSETEEAYPADDETLDYAGAQFLRGHIEWAEEVIRRGGTTDAPYWESARRTV